MKNQLIIKRTLLQFLADTIAFEAHVDKHTPIFQNALGRGGLDSMLKQLSQIQQEACKRAAARLKLIPSEQSSETVCIAWLEEDLADSQQQAKALFQIGYALQSPGSSLELRQFVNQPQWQRLCNDLGQPAVVPTQNEIETIQLDKTCLLTLAPSAMTQPTRWLLLVQGMAQQMIQSSSQAKSFTENNPALTEILSAVLALRISGPAFYVQHTLQTLGQNQFQHLFLIEPLLFEALNRFSLTHKDFLILHQMIEGLRQVRAEGITGSPFDDATKRHAFELAEMLVPERFAFTEKQFEQTLQLLDRCRDGVLISAHQQATHPDVLKASLNELVENEPLGALLEQFTETPASPFQILSTGLLYELDAGPEKITALLKDFQAGWPSFKQFIEQNNALLMRSLNVSQVHNALFMSKNAETELSGAR